MSYQPLWLRDLVAYSIQAAALVGVGRLLASVLRLRAPRVRLAYWQALLAAAVFLPLLQPWRPDILETSGSVAGSVTLGVVPIVGPQGPSLAEIVLWVICAGVVLRALWIALGLGRLWLYRRRSQRIKETPEAVKEAQILVPVRPRLFISRQLPTPATFGFFRPAILFPARFLSMEPARQKAVALHELLHVERHDWLWNMFEEAVLTLLWFHLPLWWAVRSARLSREQVVDAEAVRRSQARRPYLQALLEMAGQKRLAESLPAPLFLREGQLAERVELMMKEVRMSRTCLTVSILVAGATLLITGASLVWAFPLKAPAQPQETAISSEAPGNSPAGNPVAAEDGSGRKDTKIYKVGGDVSVPVPIYKPQPPYTRQARKNHLTGWAVFSVVINAQGRVTKVKIVKHLGQGLDESGMKTLRTWRFRPAMRKGKPVAVRIMIQISFRTDGNHDKSSAKSVPRPDPAIDPQPQAKLQRQVDKATKKALIAEQEAARIDQAKIQRQVQEQLKQLQKLNTPAMRAQMQEQMEALKELNAPEMHKRYQEQMKELEKMNTPEIRKRMQEAMKQLKKMNTPEMRVKMKKLKEQLAKLNTPEMRQRYQERMKQLEKINTPEMRQQMQEAMKQAEKINTPQMLKKLEKVTQQAQLDQAQAEKASRSEAQKQLKQARRELRATQKQLERARKQLRKQQLELKKQSKQLKPPAASPPPPPAPGSSQKVLPPPPPPASPPPPPAPAHN